VHRRLTAIVITVLAVAAAVLPACAAPSGGTTVAQGVHVGEYSVLNSPITYTYDGVAGRRVNILLYDSRPFFAPDQGPPAFDLVAPGGSVVPTAAQRQATRIFVLPVTGRYTIRFRYPVADLGVLTYTLAISQDEDRGPTGLGPITPFGSLIPGQSVSFSYAGAAGERLNRVGVDRVVAPDGTEVANNGLRPAQVTLPVTGSYRIEVTQPGAVISNDLAPIPVTLGATPVPPLLSGQNVDLLYPGTAGETLGLGSTLNVSVQLRTPDDTPVDPAEIVPRTRYTLPVTGTYRVVARGGFNTTGTSVWLSNDLDLGVIGEGSYPTPGRNPGQALSARVTVTAGEQFRIRTFDPPGVKPGVLVRSPGGAILNGVPETGPTFVSDPWVTYTATESGVHHLLVVPTNVGAVPGADLITLEFDRLG